MRGHKLNFFTENKKSSYTTNEPCTIENKRAKFYNLINA